MKKFDNNLTFNTSTKLINNMIHLAPFVMNLEEVQQQVEYTNKDIENQIAVAHSKANSILFKMNQATSKANTSLRTINRISKKANKKLSTLINKLIDETNYTAHKMVEIGKANGYTIICELVQVKIGDRLVWIDPLRIAEF